MSDQTTEQAIQAAGADKAPRITPEDLAANIVSEHYFTAAEGVFGAGIQDGQTAVIPEGSKEKPTGPLGLLTICVLVLRNGFTVVGTSACASPENFSAEIGRRIARENAEREIWPLMGYELKSRLAAAAPPLKVCAIDDPDCKDCQ